MQIPILYQKIIEQPDLIDALIKQMEFGMPHDRDEVLTTITLLIERFVEPAKELLVSSDEDPEQVYYDPQAIAGIEISGLVLGLLKSEFPHLQAPPEDRHLLAVLDDLGISIPFAETRWNFFRSWTALRTCLVIRRLILLFRDRNNLNDQQNQQELTKLRQITGSALPMLDLKLIETITIAREKKW